MAKEDEIVKNEEGNKPSMTIKQIDAMWKSRWQILLRDAANRANVSEYERSVLIQKKAIKELVDEYEIATSDDPVFADILKNIKTNLELDAKATKVSNYKSERASWKKITTALENIFSKSLEEIGKLAEKRRMLIPPKENASESQKNAFLKKEKQQIFEEVLNENRLIASSSLINLFQNMMTGYLQVPTSNTEETPAPAKDLFMVEAPDKKEAAEEAVKKAPKNKIITLNLSTNEVKKENLEEKDDYTKDDVSYFIDATNVTLTGGKENMPFGLDDEGRVKIEDVNEKDYPLFPHKPGLNDIVQGTLGDCWFVNVISGIAQKRPEMINDMMKDNGDGTVTVRLYGNVPTKPDARYNTDYKLKPIYVRVDKLFSQGSAIPYLAHTSSSCLWVNVIERAAAAAGIGYHTNLRVLPPNHMEIYNSLKANPVDPAVGKEKHPWFFTDGELKEYKPSFNMISGGESFKAINMLMGPEYHAEKESTRYSQYGKELNIAERASKITKNSTSIIDYVFREMSLNMKTGDTIIRGEDGRCDDLSLMLSNSEVNKEYRDGKQANSYAKYADMIVDSAFYQEYENGSSVNLGISSRLFSMLGNNPNDLKHKTIQAFNAKNSNHQTTNGVVVRSGDSYTTVNSNYAEFIIDRLASRLKIMLDENRANFKNDTEGNEKLMKHVASIFKNSEFTKNILEKDILKTYSSQIERSNADGIESPYEKEVVQQAINRNDARDNDPESFEQFDIYDKYVNTFIKVTQDEFAASLEKLSGLQKYAKKVSDDKIGTLFNRIKTAIDNKIIISADVDEKGNDAKKNQIIDGHAYSIINAYTDKTGQRYVTLRNPWGSQFGLSMLQNNGLKYDEKGNLVAAYMNNGIFDLKFEDFFSQVDEISYNHQLLDLTKPKEAEKKAEENVAEAKENEIKTDNKADAPERETILSSKTGHSFQCVIRDTINDLMKTKKWPYGNTSQEFNDLIMGLKDTYFLIATCKEQDIHAEKGFIQALSQLETPLNAYYKRCKASPTSGKHKERMAIVKRFADCIKSHVSMSKGVCDPRKENTQILATKMLDAYYSAKKVPADKQSEADLNKIIGSTAFNEMVDDRNIFELGKTSNSEAKKLMREFIKQYKTPVEKQEIGFTMI